MGVTIIILLGNVVFPIACARVVVRPGRSTKIEMTSRAWALSILVLLAPSNRIIGKWRTSSIFVFCPFSRGKYWHKLRKVYGTVASSDSQIDKPQRGRPKRRAELLDVNINTGAQSIDTERSSNLRYILLRPVVAFSTILFFVYHIFSINY